MRTRKMGGQFTMLMALGLSGLLLWTPGLRSEQVPTKITVEKYALYPEGADLAVSGLVYDPKEDIYWGTSDRGASDGKDAFFQPRLYQIKKVDQVFVVTKVIPLVNEDGTPVRGFAEDPKRIDPEGVTLAPDGDLWRSMDGRRIRSVYPRLARRTNTGTDPSPSTIHRAQAQSGL